MKKLLLLVTHVSMLVVGFLLGIYVLPILTAPPAPDMETVSAAGAQATYRAEFRRDLEGSDAFHWGEGEVAIGSDAIALAGRLAPGPDYRLYLSPVFVETEAAFARAKPEMLQVGHVRTFENFIVPLAPGTDLERFNTVVVWCEAFGEFITAARYR